MTVYETRQEAYAAAQDNWFVARWKGGYILARDKSDFPDGALIIADRTLGHWALWTIRGNRVKDYSADCYAELRRAAGLETDR